MKCKTPSAQPAYTYKGFFILQHVNLLLTIYLVLGINLLSRQHCRISFCFVDFGPCHLFSVFGVNIVFDFLKQSVDAWQHTNKYLKSSRSANKPHEFIRAGICVILDAIYRSAPVGGGKPFAISLIKSPRN